MNYESTVYKLDFGTGKWVYKFWNFSGLARYDGLNPTCKIKRKVKTSALGISYLSIKYTIINEYLDQVLKYLSIQVLSLSLSTKLLNKE